MRITTLIENEPSTGRQDLVAEFGLSMLVETGQGTILFDTGTTGAFADNALAMGIDLEKVDAAVLSHHHFDHGGGLSRFIKINDHAPVYLRKAPMVDRIFSLAGIIKRPIGLDPDPFERHPDRFVEIDSRCEISPGVFLITDMQSNHARPRGNRHLKTMTDDGPAPDTFDHELMMVVHQEGGLVVFTGCSHHGVLNMVETAQISFPDSTIAAVVGGFHLVGLPMFNSMAGSRAEVEQLARDLGDLCHGTVHTGHCTGRKATAVLKKILDDRLVVFETGSSFEI